MSRFLLGVLFLLRGVLSNVLQSESSTLSAMCDNIVHSVTLLNKLELLKLVDKVDCKDYRLLGDSTLASSQRGDKYCYGRVAPILCGSKYTPVKDHLNCEHIKKKFMVIMQGCIAEGSSSAQDRNCSGLNEETLAVTDPLVFCRMNFVTEQDGSQVSFKHNELDDCQSLAQSYNHCQIIGKAFNHPKFCINGGYQGYCNYYMHKIQDTAYIDLCRNFVLPFVFSNLDSRTASAPSTFCRTADVEMEKVILANRDNLMERRQQILDQLESDSAVESWKTDMKQKIDSVMLNLQDVVRQSGLSNSHAYNVFHFPYNFDPLVRSEFAKAVDACEEIMKRARNLPDSVSDTESLIRDIDSLLDLDLTIQEAVIQLKHLNSLIMSGYHSTIIATQYYKPVDKELLKKVSSVPEYIRVLISKRLSAIKPLLEAQHDLGQEIEAKSRDAANELQFIASLHESQLTSFLKMNRKRAGKVFSKSTSL